MILTDCQIFKFIFELFETKIAKAVYHNRIGNKNALTPNKPNMKLCKKVQTFSPFINIRQLNKKEDAKSKMEIS